MSETTELEKLLALLPKDTTDEISALLAPITQSELDDWQERQKNRTPFRCPFCLRECWKVEQVEVSELDASEATPYSVLSKSDVWTFGCGHKVERVSKITPVIEGRGGGYNEI